MSNIFSLIALALLTSRICSLGASGTWNTDASGDWASGSNWTSGEIADGAGFNADFTLNATADRTISLNTARTLGSLSFADATTATPASWIIAGSGSLAFSGSSGTPSVSVGAMASGRVASLQIPISGTSLVKTGSGTLALAASSSLSSLTVSQGTLELANGGQLGTGSITNNSLIRFSRTSDGIVSNGINGTGKVRLEAGGKLTLSGANSYTGGTELGGSGDRYLSVRQNSSLGTGLVRLGDTSGSSQIWFHSALDRTLPNAFEIRTARWIIDSSTINGTAAGTLTITGNVHFNQAGVADLYCNHSIRLAGGVTSTAGITKQASGTFTLSGSAAYNGDTRINGGTFAMEGSLTTTGTTYIQSGATITGDGVVTGPVTVYSGGILAAGKGGVGKLRTGRLVTGPSATVEIALGAPGDADNAQVAVTGMLDLGNGGRLRIVPKPGFASGVYPLITHSGSRSGTFSALELPGDYMGSLSYVSGEVRLTVLPNTLVGPANGIMISWQESLKLDWTAPPGVVSYDVYLGGSESGVAAATTSTSGLFKGNITLSEYTAAGIAAGVNFWRIDYRYADGTVIPGPVWKFEMVVERDLMPDTWVATDALDRELPGHALTGPPRDDRQTAIFYFLWHHKSAFGADGPRDNTREIERLGGYTNKNSPWSDNPGWMQGGNGRQWYWGEPEAGYYASDDEWVIRRHIQWLVAAGVDILAFDNTNGNPALYKDAWVKIAETIRKMRREGMKIDLKFLFYTYSGSPATMTWLYQNLYQPGLYPELWLMWDGKPAIVGYRNQTPTPLATDIADFFTIRTGWANAGGTLANEWQWMDSVTPQDFGWTGRNDIPVQAPAAAGGWANSNHGRSYSNRSQPGYDNFHLATARTHGEGRFFAEQLHYGLKIDPKILFLTGWNEWWAQSLTADTYHPGYNVLNNSCAVGQRYFVDAYTAEYSRDIEPMNGGYGDNYYYQMVAANRFRKGTRPVPYASPALSGPPVNFTGVGPEYLDATYDTFSRNAPGTFSNLGNYTNTSGRNDFRVLKVARDPTYLYFHAETRDPVTAASGSNWMNLFLDTDGSRSTGWEGYDYVINYGGSGQVRSLSGSTWNPVSAGSATVTVSGRTLTIRVARATLGLGADPLRLDFKWADNYATAGSIASFSTGGDTAPDRRFNYRYRTMPTEELTLREDGFENGQGSSWGETFNPGTQWQIAATTPYTGTRCLVGTGRSGATDASGTLVNRTSTAGLESFHTSFRYKLSNVQDAQNIEIYYRNSANQWISIRELGRDQFHASGQAWGYNERQNVWLNFSDARINSGADSAWFHPNFSIHIQIKNLTSTTQSIAIDDFSITGTRAIALPAAASGPEPANAAANVATQTSLTWIPGAGADSQQVYFGLPGNLQLAATLAGNAQTYLPGTLAHSTSYVWRIDSTNVAGTTTGPVWSFSTAPPPNQAPVLAPIADLTIIAGQTLSITASATDPDLPAQPLVFSLSNPSVGAAITPATGVLTWRPVQAQAPGTYPFTVVVADNGSPSLTATRSFNITVVPPAVPSMDSFSRDAYGAFRFRISGDSGPDYRIWASENLKDWQLLESFPTSVPPFWFEDSYSKDWPRRFYKIQLGP